MIFDVPFPKFIQISAISLHRKIFVADQWINSSAKERLFSLIEIKLFSMFSSESEKNY